MHPIVIAASVVVTVSASAPRPARAEILYPWCYHEVSEAGYVSCAYSTFDQCMASRHGSSGFCVRNALYDPNATRKPARKPR
jgi:hypothetical protein